MLKQREILFRGWNGKDMIYGGFSIHATGSIKANIEERMLSGLLEEGNFPVMQYTGIKDCVGKKIFEGDIIEVDWDKKREKVLVWFSEGSFLYEIAPSYSFYLSEADNPKILGNIFNNSDLLGKRVIQCDNFFQFNPANQPILNIACSENNKENYARI